MDNRVSPFLLQLAMTQDFALAARQAGILAEEAAEILLKSDAKAKLKKLRGALRRLPRREEILAGLYALAFAPCNDAVKLVFLPEDAGPEIFDGLQLLPLKSFKKLANGSVEVVLADRLEALKLLLALCEDEGALGPMLEAIRSKAEGEQITDNR